MMSVVFLVCSLQGQCFTASSQQVFRDRMTCETFAEMTILQNQQQDKDAGRPPRLARYQCVEWSQPT